MKEYPMFGRKTPEVKVPYQKDPKPLGIRWPSTSTPTQGKSFEMKIDEKKLAAAVGKK